MNGRPVVRYQVEVGTLTSSLKAFRLIFLGTLVMIALLGSLTPSMGVADRLGRSNHASCRNASSKGCSFDYSISLRQTSASLVQGTSVSLNVSVSLSRGVSGPVDLSLRQLPDGLKVSLNPSSGQPPFDSKLSISAGPVSPIGSFIIVVTGSSPTAGVRSASLSLTVSQAVHDVAILDLKAPAAGKPGDLVDVNITVASYGPLVETVQVQLIANKTRILAVESLSVKPFS